MEKGFDLQYDVDTIPKVLACKHHPQMAHLKVKVINIQGHYSQKAENMVDINFLVHFHINDYV